MVSKSITEVRGAETGRDTVRLQGGGGTLGLGPDWTVQTAQENTGGETLSDHGGLQPGLPPGVVEAGLAQGAGRHLGRVPRVEPGAVRGLQ